MLRTTCDFLASASTDNSTLCVFHRWLSNMCFSGMSFLSSAWWKKSIFFQDIRVYTALIMPCLRFSSSHNSTPFFHSDVYGISALAAGFVWFSHGGFSCCLRQMVSTPCSCLLRPWSMHVMASHIQEDKDKACRLKILHRSSDFPMLAFYVAFEKMYSANSEQVAGLFAN